MPMRIVTWNCNGAFRRKFHALDQFDADILIIQECEDPAQSKSKDYMSWSTDYFWTGDSKNKGLGVFLKKGVYGQLLDWPPVFEGKEVKHFLPFLINGDFQLVGVWTHQNNSPTFGYIGQLWKYIQLHQNKLDKGFVTGDFNSNAIWDRKNRWWNHTDVVHQLAAKGIKSAYHLKYNEESGEESIPTFYLQKNLNKPYHIDYIFCPEEYHNRITNFEIGTVATWLPHSDHMPLFLELSSDALS